ncbi:MAG: FlgD immunoglobulin-like domain containing protein [Candidatus Cloacimonadaceae bacterium]|nr:T9SS type A sorting domain-containing protein [Candidatus Cloacimonadota bacterium]MCK9243275.1 T9SS type A sorting domain-containing protein [Candidatus Cloacimonadota bacterium]
MKNLQNRTLKGIAPELHLTDNALRFAAVQSRGAFMLRLIPVFMLLFLCFSAHAATLGVALDGSQAFTVIQEAINASAHSDTVLVYPGRYYENVRFNGKNITLASLELLTGNRGYVYSTIIDADFRGVGIFVNDNESSIKIQGFTVVNGTGHYTELYDWTTGGGIAVGRMSGQRQAEIINCHATNNRADNGAGVYLGYCQAFLSGVSIHHNTGSFGAGIYFAGSINQYNAIFDPVNRCSIYSNYAAFGSDLYFYNVNSVHVVVDTFTVANPWNFYATAIPANPNISNPYTFDILNTVHEEVNHDLYVAPWGDDANSGISPAQPMQSIFMAMYRIASDSENPKSVHVADGHYSPSLNGQLFPIPIKSHTRLVGESREGTILDAEHKTTVVKAPAQSRGLVAEKLTIINGKRGISYGTRSEDYAVCDVNIANIFDPRLVTGFSGYKGIGNINIKNLSLSNVSSTGTSYVYDQKDLSGSLSLSNLEISSCEAPEMDAIYISSRNESDVFIDGLEVHNNRSTISGDFGFNSMFQISPYSIYGERLRIEIKNSAFYDNYQGTNNHMAMARSLNDTLFISNCTFAGNSGGGSAVAVQGTNVLTNNVFYNPAMTTQILIPDYISSGIYSPTTLINNNILGGSAGVYNATPQNPLYWGAGNTDYDPLFVGEGNRPYTLSPVSPLIDAGWQAASGVISNSVDAAGNERYWDGDGDGVTVIDVGAYEYQPIYSPINLTCELSGQQIDLSWQMPLMDRGLSGFRIYRNDAAYVDISDPSTAHFRDYSAVNDTLTYYVVALYGNVESAASNTVTVIIDSVANADELAVPISGSISVAPNPFRDIAVISYEIPKQSEVELKLYNIRGQLVKRLFAGNQAKGEQVLAWDGCNDDARYLPAGVYLLRITVDGAAKKPLRILKL